jgi:hypothetical protein
VGDGVRAVRARPSYQKAHIKTFLYETQKSNHTFICGLFRRRVLRAGANNEGTDDDDGANGGKNANVAMKSQYLVVVVKIV